MSQPLVSIVTPSYNQSEFIKETLASVNNQNYPNIEHIVVDGGSTDGTVEILKQFDVSWTSESDRGQSHAINKGFRRAEGEIVGWINSDDPYVFRSTINTVVQGFQTTDADILYGHAITIGPKSELLRVHCLPPFDPDQLRRFCYLIQPSVFFEQHVIKNNEINEDREYSMDYEFWLDLLEQYDWQRLDSILAADRNHSQRKIIANSEESANDTSNLHKEHGIEHNWQYTISHIADRIRLRYQRFHSLPLLYNLLRRDQSEFAFDLIRQDMCKSFKTQLIGRKKSL